MDGVGGEGDARRERGEGVPMPSERREVTRHAAVPVAGEPSRRTEERRGQRCKSRLERGACLPVMKAVFFNRRTQTIHVFYPS